LIGVVVGFIGAVIGAIVGFFFLLISPFRRHY
jgi:ABC-type lipoprotein release transport system permease subunit